MQEILGTFLAQAERSQQAGRLRMVSMREGRLVTSLIVTSCLVGGGARTDPCLASMPVLEVGTSIFLLSRRLLEVTKAGATTSPNPDFMLGVRLSLCYIWPGV